jgi:hypothetical protein
MRCVAGIHQGWTATELLESSDNMCTDGQSEPPVMSQGSRGLAVENKNIDDVSTISWLAGCVSFDD